jgi:hypothetical protein
MKRIITIAIFVLASIVTVRSAIAQNHTVRVTIPFSFSADDKLLPAGTYTITSKDLHGVLIQNDKQSVNMLSSAPIYEEKLQDDRLIFNKYGDQYFLRKILCSYAHMSLELPASKIEKRARLQEGNHQGSIRAFLALNR